MSATDVLATARLQRRFDPRQLWSETAKLRDHAWLPERPFDHAGPGMPITAGWDALPLRSQGGDVRRTDPGGPGLDDFADTPLLAELPYLALVLRSLPCELRSARLLSLAPGAQVAEHVDAHHGLEHGQVRLHVPISTNPDALLLIEERPYHWEPGQLWYGDFGRRHAIRNDGETERIHLVIDCLMNPHLLNLFPKPFRASLSPGSVLHNRVPRVLDPDELSSYRCQFDIPSIVIRSMAAEPDGVGSTAARIDAHDDGLRLFMNSRPVFELRHLGDDDFRFAGWTEERTVRILRGPDGPEAVIFRMRTGNRARDLRCPAHRPAAQERA
jgi:hypothetical protein